MPSSQTPYTSALETFYNAQAPSYNTTTSSIHTGGSTALVTAAHPAISPGASVLDLATGTGKVALAAAAQVGLGPGGHVLGIDIADAFLDVARRAAVEQGVSAQVAFLQRDVADLDLPPTYAPRWADAVTCGSAIALFAVPGDVLTVLARDVLKPGGVFVADVYATNVPASVFLNVAAASGFKAPVERVWLEDPETAFRSVFEASEEFQLKSVRKGATSVGRWDVGSEEKMEGLWTSLSKEQVWVSFGLQELGEEKVGEIKKKWKEEMEGLKDGDGVVVKEVVQWIAVAVVRG